MVSSLFVIIVALINISSSQINLEECQKSKVCIFITPDCEINGYCEKIISYSAQPDDWVIIELFYNTTHPDTNYVAVGFSTDTRMGDEIVTHCGIDEMNQAGVFLSQNDGKHNIPLNLMNQNSTKYVELLEISHTANSIYCKFRQKITPEEEVQQTFLPNLNRSYHLLLAYGTASKYAEMDSHSLDQDSKDFPSFISKPVNVASLENLVVRSAPVKPKTNRKFVIFHGILMLIGWMSLIPSAIAVARYLREHWPNRKPFGLSIWFHIHRTMNYVAVIIVIISVLFVFIGKEWRWTGPTISKTIQRNLSPGSLHSIIGATAIGLMVIQPIGALIRCQQGTKFRDIFNFVHRTIGLLSFLLAQIAIILSVIFFRTWITRWAAIILYSSYLIIVALLLFLINKISQRRQQHTSVTYAGQNYYQEQIVITKSKHDNKSKELTVIVVLTFTATGMIITFVMVVLMLATL